MYAMMLRWRVLGGSVAQAYWPSLAPPQAAFGLSHVAADLVPLGRSGKVKSVCFSFLWLSLTPPDVGASPVASHLRRCRRWTTDTVADAHFDGYFILIVVVSAIIGS